jgi:uncharacterized protein
VKLEQSFEVDAPVERVWAALIEVERVAPCLPGAAVTGRNEDGSYNGSFSVKIGPTSASYTGKLVMQDIDEGARRATMLAEGTDKRGQGGAKATIVSTLSPAEGGATRVAVDTDYRITGRLARFGRGGMIEDISARLLREFAGRLQQSLAGEGAAASEAAPGSSASGSVSVPVSEDSEPLGPAAAEPDLSAASGRSATESSESFSTGVSDPSATESSESFSTGASAAPAHSETSTGAAPPPPAEPIQGLSLIGSVLAGRFRRSPATMAGAGGLVLLLLFLALRRRAR